MLANEMNVKAKKPFGPQGFKLNSKIVHNTLTPQTHTNVIELK